MPSETAVKCFLSAAEHHSFTRAAEALFMTRQAVSRQIARLERELGLPLFRRTTAEVKLTPAGEIFRRYFLQAETLLEQARRDAAAALAAEKSRLNAGYLTAVDLTDLLDRTLQDCRNMGLPVPLAWERRPPEELTKMLLQGQLDLILSYAIPDILHSDRLAHRLLQRLPTVLAVSRSHPLVRPGAAAQDFQSEPFIMWRRNTGDDEAERQIYRADCARHGLRAARIEILPNPESARTAVELGGGVVMCSTLSVICSSPSVVTYPVAGTTDLICCWRREDTRPNLRSLVELLAANSRQAAGSGPCL